MSAVRDARQHGPGAAELPCRLCDGEAHGLDALEVDSLAGMGGMGQGAHLGSPSKVIGQIDFHGFSPVEPEYDTPVGAHANAPRAGSVAAQPVHPVQPVPRRGRGAGPLGDLEVGGCAADRRH